MLSKEDCRKVIARKEEHKTAITLNTSRGIAFVVTVSCRIFILTMYYDYLELCSQNPQVLFALCYRDHYCLVVKSSLFKAGIPLPDNLLQKRPDEIEWFHRLWFLSCAQNPAIPVQRIRSISVC